MALSPTRKKHRGPTQVSFIVHAFRGDHLEEQAAVVSINENTFILKPRTKRGDTRYYEGGYTTFIEVSSEIRFAIAICTPNQHNKFFFHTFALYDFKPPIVSTLQKITLTTPAKSYEITASIFTTPSPYGSEEPTFLLYSSPSPYRNTTKTRASTRLSLLDTPEKYPYQYVTPKKSATFKSAPNSPSKTPIKSNTI